MNKCIFFIVFKSLFNKENRENFPRVYRVYSNTCGTLGETQNCVETLALCARIPTQFLVSPKFPRVFL